MVIGIWIIYLFTIQVFDPYNLRNIYNSRYKARKEIIVPRRGDIFDRNNEILVTSLMQYQIDIDRKSIKIKVNNSKEKYAQIINKISEIISQNSQMKKTTVKKRLKSKSLARSVMIGNNFNQTELTKIKDKFKKNNIPGLISGFSSMKRIYPHETLAARLLGITKEKNKSKNSIYSIKGICGLEASFDNYLKGEYGWRQSYYDAHDDRIPMPNLTEKYAKPGNSLTLTLNLKLQEIVEKYLREGLEQYNAKNAIGIFMDANTGEILSMAGVSTKDKHYNSSSLRAMPNLPVSFTFEPGSTIKPITALSALKHKVVPHYKKIDCQTYKTKGRTISDAHEFDNLNLKDIIAYSSNVGISKIAEKIGKKKLYNLLIEFGFGNKTGSNFVGENRGLLRKINHWQGYSLHSISFGQEMSSTALQLASAYCTIANNGNVLRPLVVKEIRDENKNIVKSFEPKILREISAKSSLDTLKSYLKAVVDYGTASSLDIPGLSVAGKTGTAEKATKNGTYSDELYTSLFAGFFPVDNPKVVGVIIFDEPSYRYRYGSQSSVPTFEKIVKNLIALPSCNIMTEVKENRTDFIKVPDLIGLSFDKANDILKNKNIQFTKVVVDPNGLVINQYPKANIAISKNRKVSIIVDKKKKVQEIYKDDSHMPNLVGMTVKKVIQISN